MNKLTTNFLAILTGVGLASNVIAIDELHSFSAGEAALASEVNENFEYLEDKIDDVVTGYSTLTIDCGADEYALKDYLDEARWAGRLNIYVEGTCTGEIYFNKDDVYIFDAVIQADADGAAVSVAGKTNIRFYDTVISSGTVAIRRESYVRFEGVDSGMGFELPALSADSDGIYEPSLEVRSSTLRIGSGTISNLSLKAMGASFVYINDDVVLDNAYQIWLESGSALDSSIDLSILGTAGVFSGSVLQAESLSSAEAYVEKNALIETDAISTTGEFYLADNATVHTEDLDVGSMELERGSVLSSTDIDTTGNVEVKTNSVLTTDYMTTGDLRVSTGSVLYAYETLEGVGISCWVGTLAIGDLTLTGYANEGDSSYSLESYDCNGNIDNSTLSNGSFNTGSLALQ
ncbi:hypothetical protein [Reinekea marinisedimentorum]|uniref:Uncharacterized protein n=1 Tax=Reinekea marinisedimentorum TaxID=230495 RepID=A0A4R3ID40_9GAMM|nr:hypothetical protein [Reinekea marinisedimentorum]TCS43347.1 hypothetical protein BCF53_102374 [Reinekea marinisedimentorum]